MSGRAFMVLMLGLLGLQVALVLGSWADRNGREKTSRQNGYVEGWQAREALVAAHNASMRGVGLCRYAEAACGRTK